MASLDILLLKIYSSSDAGVLWDTSCKFHGFSALFLGNWFKTTSRTNDRAQTDKCVLDFAVVFTG